MPYESKPRLTTPSDDTVLWRYMDFARFVQLLESQQIWFSRVDQFDDPLEGTITDGEWLSSPPLPSSKPGKTRLDALHPDFAQMVRYCAYVSCWRMGSHQSLAMWDIYGKGSGIVAITTTVGILKQQFLEETRPVFMTQVEYIDWKALNVLDESLIMVSRKDISYAHEAEMRAIIWETYCAEDGRWRHPGVCPLGFSLNTDLQVLISEIWIGPREMPWVRPLVEKLTTRYGLTTPVLASDKLIPRLYDRRSRDNTTPTVR